MEELPDSMRQQVIRPVVGIIGTRDLYNLLIKKLDDRLDFESLDYTSPFSLRKEGKLFERLKGIIKQDWTSKVRRSDPGALVIIEDLREVPDNWREKEQEILKHIRDLRHKNKGKYLKIALIILASDEINTEEKTNFFRKYSELDSKAIVLSKDRLASFNAQSFRKYIYEAAISHYKDEVDRYKKMKSKANKEYNFPELQIRYDFKLGYINELKTDRDDALNYYKKAYEKLKNYSPIDYIHFEEIRTMADWTLYRLCVILLGEPYSTAKIKEAISIFKTHLTAFANRSILPFEQSKWLSTCYVRFGGLLEHLPTHMLSPEYQWAHSGLYFAAAADHIQLRMSRALKDPSFNESVVNWKNYIQSENLKLRTPEYLGQVKTLEGDSSFTESISYHDQINIVKSIEESDFPHIQHAADLLFRALKFYRTVVPLPHTAVSLSTRLAKLYGKKGETELAYKMFADVWSKMHDWTPVASYILGKIKKLGESAKIQEKAQWTLHYAAFNQEAFSEIQQTIEDENEHIQLFMPTVLMTATSKFLPKSAERYSTSDLCLEIANKTPLCIENCKVFFKFNDSSYDSESPSLVTIPKNANFSLSIPVLIRETGNLVLERIFLNIHNVSFSLKASAVLRVVSPTAKLIPEIHHSPPAYIAEEYSLKLNFERLATILSAKLSLNEDIKDEGKRRRASIDRYTESKYNLKFTALDKTLPYTGSILLDSDALEFTFFFYEEGIYDFKLELAYEVMNEHGLQFICEEEYPVSLSVFAPFMVYTKILQKGHGGILFTTLQAQETQSIEIHSLEILPNDSWNVENKVIEFEKGRELTHQSLMKHSFAYKHQKNLDELYGDIKVNWSRKKYPQAVCNVPFTLEIIKNFPVSLDVDVVANIQVFQIAQMEVKIANMSAENVDIKVNVEPTKNILVAGPLSVKIDLRSNETVELGYTLLPSESGTFQLPNVNLKCKEGEKKWEGRILVHP